MRSAAVPAVLLFAHTASMCLPGQRPPRPDMYQDVPNARAMRDPSGTTKPYRLDKDGRTLRSSASPHAVVLRLPPRTRTGEPKLAAALRNGSGLEIFLVWTDSTYSEKDGFASHVEIYRPTQGGDAALVHDFEIFGGPGASLWLFEPPDSRDQPSVLVDVMGGSYWGTTYVISPDRTAISKIASGSDRHFADLDRDGVYEFISWNRRPNDVHCSFGIFGVRFYPEVFVRSGWEFHRVWPPADWSHPEGQVTAFGGTRPFAGEPGPELQVVAGFASVAGDGHADLICLQDRFQTRPEQSLAIYRFYGSAFHPLTRVLIHSDQIAYLLSGVVISPRGPEITVFLAPPDRCAAGGMDSAASGKSQVRYIYDRAARKLNPFPR